jgi:hypothetical protein
MKHFITGMIHKLIQAAKQEFIYTVGGNVN